MSKLSERTAFFIERHRVLYKTLLLLENAVKKPVFKCQSCGQCVLSQTAFTCPMRCPKQIRNGPCGGTREGGFCEVFADRFCIWYLIYQRSVKLNRVEMLDKVQIPVDRRLQNTSAWLNMMAGRIEAWTISHKK